MTRLLFVIPSLDESGAEKQFSLLVRHLPREEFEARVVVLTRGGPYETALKQAGIPYEILHKRGKFDPLAWWRLRAIVRTWKPDLLHTWLFAGNAYGRLVAGGSSGPPVIVSERCVDTWKQKWQTWLDRRLIARTARLVGNSESVAEFYRNLGYPSHLLRVVRNGQQFEPRIDPQRAFRREEWSGGHPRPFIIGCVGRLAKQKRVEDLIWAIELLRSVRDDLFLVLVGDGPERKDLEVFVSHLKLEQHVRFLGHQQCIPELLSCFDVLTLASDFEGQSNSIMEGMAAGLPVIVSDIPPNRELLGDQETGILVSVGDRAQFAREIQRLCDHPELRTKFGTAAQRRITKDFSLERMVSGYVELYREVLAGQTPARDSR